MQPSDLNAFLEPLPADARDIVLALREVIARTVPTAEERLLWKGLFYHRPWIGGPIKGAVCQIVAKRGEVRLDFVHGIRLSDPHHLLQGDRLSKRHVPIRTIADAKRPEIAELIDQAAQLNPADWHDG